MTGEPTLSPDRIPDATLERLAQSHERVSVIGAGAWDGIDLMDLLHDLMLARAQRDRYRTLLSHRR